MKAPQLYLITHKIKEELTSNSFFMDGLHQINSLEFIKLRYKGVRKLKFLYSYTDSLYFNYHLFKIVTLGERKNINIYAVEKEIKRLKTKFNKKLCKIQKEKIDSEPLFIDQSYAYEELSLYHYYIEFLDTLLKLPYSSEHQNSTGPSYFAQSFSNHSENHETTNINVNIQLNTFVYNSTNIQNVSNENSYNSNFFHFQNFENKNKTDLNSEFQENENKKPKNTYFTGDASNKRVMSKLFKDYDLLDKIYPIFRNFLDDSSKINSVQFKNLLLGEYEKNTIKINPTKHGYKMIMLTFHLLEFFEIIKKNYPLVFATEEIIATENDFNKFYSSNDIKSGFLDRWNSEKKELIPLKTNSTLFKLQIQQILNLLKNWDRNLLT